MKKVIKISALILCLLLINSHITAQEQFEGEVQFEITEDDETTTMNYMVKGDKIRIEIPDEEDAIMLMDTKESKMFIIMDDQNMYMEIPVKNYITGEDLKDESDDNGSFKKTGETKEINGYLCEKFIFEGENGSSESWMTSELGSFMFFGNPMEGEKKPEWQKQIEGIGYFPMLIISNDESGDEMRFEAKSVTPKILDKNLFIIPDNYQKIGMP